MLAGKRSSTSVPAPTSLHTASFPPDQCGAFRHAAQSVMSLNTLAGEHLRIDPLAIVTPAQSEVLAVVADLGLDLPGVPVPEGIPKRFHCDLVDFVAKNWVQIAGPPLDGRRPQAPHGVPPLGDRPCGVFTRPIQCLFCFCRTLRQQVRRRLRSQQQTVEALKQRVLQLPCDVRSPMRASAWRRTRAASDASGTGTPPTAAPQTDPRRRRGSSRSCTTAG
jgi:hypothetical protein